MRRETLVESRTRLMQMRQEDALELQAVGRRLASNATWWGSELGPVDRTVLHCTPHEPGQWSVRVNDAVGIIATSRLQLVVEPKIPTLHLLHLFGESGRFPRLDTHRVHASMSESLWTLVAEWFVAAMELVLRRGLMRDYHETTESSRFIRGRLDVPDATRAYYGGRTSFLCHFEEFGFDTALNRELKSASRVVQTSQLLKPDLRRRASGITSRLDEVEDLRPTDLRATTTRKTQHYGDAYLLAQHVIRSSGRYLSHGDSASWAFLIRTPEMVEDGLLKVLSDQCKEWSLYKRGIQLSGSSMTLNPDIVVEGGIAVADVKYKIAKTDWNRGDLYQVVTFATGYRTLFGAVVDFREPDTPQLPSVQVGETSVVQLSWPADPLLHPDVAASRLARSFSMWLRDLRAA